MLEFLLGRGVDSSRVSSEEMITKGNRTQLLVFDQKPYANSINSLAESGYLLIPDVCDSPDAPRCHLLAFFHGCSMYATHPRVKHDFVLRSGFAQAAQQFHVVVFFPQLTPSHARGVHARNGCWDSYGYTGPDYCLRRGAQMEASMRMVRTLGARYTAS
eukprot:NODE_2129_length_1286_cov_29.201293_g1937_i0.p1 GENE.NODE_2129_length_1286_cov_29.201293_g1937_i0~~NODE_2129_length_1286_cov_29.201293_g1937_i0.p1  ORF type:complete len:159 (+),score=12.08 NODE_2129_length_1286_cov_29.201293_g1937_i0:680-1156(+)